ncbi:MAG: type II toxin-antitoxin system VapC family toxin [Zavarzinella sp.]|nr:type II toxin-antitoxin system VapC family toxin [Zavarzinella sp.]
MPRPPVFADTSFFIALENKDDPYHDRAKKLDRELLKKKVLYVLHRGILLEVGDGYAKRDRRAKGVKLLAKIRSESGYQIISISDEIFAQAEELYEDRRDKEWGLTDCVSFVLMRAEGIREALASDKHFQQAGFKALLLEIP